MCRCYGNWDYKEERERSTPMWYAVGMGVRPRSILILFLAVFLLFFLPLWVFAQDASPQPPTIISMWSVVVGALLPILIAAANRLPIPNYLVALVLCVGAAFGDVYFSGRLNPGDWAQSLLTIFFTVVTSYKAFWQPSGITNKIEGKS